MAIQLGLRGVWPAIKGDDPADHEVESFLTHNRRSVMKDRISKKDHKKRENYRDGGSLAELGALGARRKEPTSCDSIIKMHEAQSFRIPDSFKVIPMGSPHRPAAIHRQQLAQIHSKNEHSATSFPVCHPMYVAGNQRLQDLQAGCALCGGEDLHGGSALGREGLENPLPGRQTRTHDGRGSECARARRIRGVRQLCEPTSGTSLGSEEFQCWMIKQFHKRVT
jgi:hypothetical protein